MIASLLPEAGGPHAIGWVMITLAACALTLERVMALVRGFRKNPPAEATFISKHECGIHHNAMGSRVLTLEARMDRVERKMEQDKVEIIAAFDARLKAIDSRVDNLSQTLSAVEERSKQTNQMVILLSEKMDRFLERAADAGNTGGKS